MKDLPEIIRQKLEEERMQNSPMFLGWPDRWYEAGKVRCTNGHISKTTLKTEKGSKCLQCFAQVWLTFPEDKEVSDIEG